MPPKKSGQSRGNQRLQSQPKQSSISEYSDLALYVSIVNQQFHLQNNKKEKLSKENPEIEEILDQIKDIEDHETKENVLQNFAVLILKCLYQFKKLVGLNSFIFKLEGKTFQSLDEDFFKSEIEQNLKLARDFNWVFTTKKEEHKCLKNNIYTFFDSILSQNQYYQNGVGEDSFMEQLSKFMILLSRKLNQQFFMINRSNIQNVRQNVVRLARIFVEQGLHRLQKLIIAQKRKLDNEEQFLKNKIEEVLTSLINGIFYARIVDKSQSIQEDCIYSFEEFIKVCPSIALTYENLIQLSTIFDGKIESADILLQFLIDIKWSESQESKSVLEALFLNDIFKKRLIFFSNFTKFVTSYRSIKFINIAREILPADALKDKELKKAMATVFHQYEDVRSEGLQILYKFLISESNKNNQLSLHRLILDGNDDDEVKHIFMFKKIQSYLNLKNIHFSKFENKNNQNEKT